MSLPVALNVQPCLYQGWADNPSNEEDADLSNLLQFHSCLTYEGDVVVDPVRRLRHNCCCSEEIEQKICGVR